MVPYPYIFASGIGVALAILAPLGWKWRMPMNTVLPAALVIGTLSGAVTTLIAASVDGLRLGAAIPIEIFFTGAFAAAAIAIRFYRDPERIPPETDKVILAPADGKVIYVNEVERGSALVSTKKGRQFRLNEIIAVDTFGNPAYLIGIDMNMLNVHVNRAPVGGKVVLHKRTEGSFISLRRPESETVNERVTMIIDNGLFSIGVIQIASRLVRRIVSYAREGDMVQIGQRIGVIRFGSQVDLAIPKLENLRILVAPGDEVLAGITVVARYGRE